MAPHRRALVALRRRHVESEDMSMLHRRRGALMVCVALLTGVAAIVACTGTDPSFGDAPDAADGGNMGLDDAGTGPDTADRPCDPGAPFGTPVSVGGLARKDFPEMGARFTADERTVFFNNNGIDGGLKGDNDGGISFLNFYADIYTITRPTTAEPFGAATLIPNFATSTLEVDPTITADGQTIYFASTDTGTQVTTIWTALRRPAGSSVQFFDPAPLSGPVNQGGSQLRPYVLPDGRGLYFTSSRDGTNKFYRAARVNGALSDVSLVPGILPAPKEVLDGIVVTADELTAYWSTSRNGGSVDIYVASRSDTTSPFSGAKPLIVLNTALAETPTFVSADGCRLYYASSEFVTTGVGETFEYHSDIFVATKPK
jgi:hypothetical protein